MGKFENRTPFSFTLRAVCERSVILLQRFFLWFSFGALFQHLNSDEMYSEMYWSWYWYSGVVLTNLLFLVLNMWFLFHYYYCYCNILILSKEFWRERRRVIAKGAGDLAVKVMKEEDLLLMVFASHLIKLEELISDPSLVTSMRNCRRTQIRIKQMKKQQIWNEQKITPNKWELFSSFYQTRVLLHVVKQFPNPYTTKYIWFHNRCT